MGYTYKTEHYELPQYISKDVPSILRDTNGAYKKIDEAIYEVSQSAESASVTVSEAVEKAESALSVAGEAKEIGESALSSAGEAKETAEGISGIADEAKEKAESALSVTGELEESVGAISGEVETLKETVGSGTLAVGNDVIGAINILAGGGSLTFEKINVENEVTFDTFEQTNRVNLIKPWNNYKFLSLRLKMIASISQYLPISCNILIPCISGQYNVMGMLFDNTSANKYMDLNLSVGYVHLNEGGTIDFNLGGRARLAGSSGSSSDANFPKGVRSGNAVMLYINKYSDIEIIGIK